MVFKVPFRLAMVFKVFSFEFHVSVNAASGAAAASSIGRDMEFEAGDPKNDRNLLNTHEIVQN